ncbi:DUF2333 family protein [Reinekea marina]|uniref:DUF2333 family protein n=1 Tax=Reinekea marina TaxID=1310421 RepID=A0ABV7WS20_9GAMM|nr:DUF2333 family protein [Reinekea marina]MDN3650548.1 DUF2333 family protein [Reinekea marina]
MLKARILRSWNELKFRFSNKSEPSSGAGKKKIGRLSIFLIVALAVIWSFLGILWSREPAVYNMASLAKQNASEQGQQLVVGYTTTYTLSYLADFILTKPGGYLANDVTPPSIFLDNMPSWEFGVVIQLRDLSRSLRKDMSRSQSQSTEDEFLAKAEPLLHFDHDSWMLPATEGQYREAIKLINKYLVGLADVDKGNAQFYARADNLSSWLRDVETRLGSLSQRLSASVGQTRFNTDLAGQSAMSEQSTPTGQQQQVKTPRLLVDNVFYEARGTSWALIHILQAIEVDFESVLEDKNALVSLQQIIRELEGTQSNIWSPIILNGDGLGILANHSLVMANYISRANAAIIDLRELLEKG